ncbi:MAG: hypothetical protein ACI3XG_09615 [Faecousia sp.]
MKKCLLLLALCLLLCGCGAGQPKETIPTETEAVTLTPPETTAPEATVPETTQAAQPPVITKDPTGEKLSPGGKTWFVAHAEGASFLTWEFLSPDGAVYSVTEAMSLHPGLLLDSSKEDTVALENVPLSLNGWWVRARFDGPGGSATTQAALITVTQSEGAYDSVIEKYRTAMAHKDESNEVPAQYDVSEMIFYAAHVGYAKKDLDGNGTEELIVAGIGYDIPEEPFLFEIFTLDNGIPVSVGRSSARSRLFLMQDSKIYNEGSSGAASSNFSVMQLSGSQLRFLNGLYTTDTLADGSPSPYTYYYTTSNQYGDLALLAGDNGMEEKVANTFLTSWRDSVTLPELCLIA